ncbi:MAG TPA: tripartite tricarboxylate transporter substrate binding protein [Burkholderiales bacterium]|nr:tripartite tricarboxylate transporter substrate binding protein [Burkholderiales bacterium]
MPNKSSVPLCRCPLALGSFIALAATTLHASAQAYPAKPIRLIVSLAPAGGMDVTSRMFAQKLGEHLNQQVVVENRPGAGGAVGGDLVAKAPADGYTLLTASIAYAVIPSSHKNLPYDPIRDLAPIAVMVNAANILVVHPSLPVKSVRELIAFAKAHPGALSYSSGGNGAAAHLMMEAFKLATGTDMLHIPYKGTGPGMVDLLAGRISLTVTGVASSLEYVKQGKLRVLATPGTKRSLAMPAVPTIAEAGVPGYAVDNWYALFAPAATPKEVVAQLNGEVIRIFHSADLKDRLVALGLEPAGEPLANTNTYIRSEIARWAKVVKAAKITVE